MKYKLRLYEIKSTHRRSDFTRRRRISYCEAIFHPPARVDLVEKDDCFRNRLFLAESVRFELTVGHPITSFQDWLLKPLGQLSMCKQSYHFDVELSSDVQLSSGANVCGHFLNAGDSLIRVCLDGNIAVQGSGLGLQHGGFRVEEEVSLSLAVSCLLNQIGQGGIAMECE